jgi:hypothetical protein
MELLTDLEDASLLEIQFADTIRNKARVGVISYRAPFYYHFRVENAKGDMRKVLIILVVPVSPGRSRILLAPVTRRPLPTWVPRWLIHALSNRFLDTDVWIHDQERLLRGAANAYTTPATPDSIPAPRQPSASDQGPQLWRQWWQQHLVPLSPAFGAANAVDLQWLSHSQQYDRVLNHARHCVYCDTARRRAQLVQKFAPFAALVLLGLLRSSGLGRSKLAIFRILPTPMAAAFYLLTDKVANMVLDSIEGPREGELTGVAHVD